jgi:hypothetical protein
MLREDIFSRDKDKSGRDRPLEFEFHLSGDLTHPVIDLRSDLIKFSVREKEEV